eukprot:CAMPEP_0195070960 /NCGR_PEP_ID=MMETSP0448-20130528/14889_1 /TAXON_ID=66468 /ORGANISM="Heterocapsa triquestra, Strain CCMP 448" /LENGTH=239 /DNA_ID=CAMNT_0040102741 /DNA_START=106 /DNA_END=825 /DNA_ORIENTATION=-
MAPAHPAPAMSFEVPVQPGRVPASASKGKHIEKLLFKTTPCSFFEKGCCKKGESCSFAHGDVDRKLRPDLTKTVMCTSWSRRQACKAGANCKFAHGPDDLRNMGHTTQTTSAMQQKNNIVTSNVFSEQIVKPSGLHPSEKDVCNTPVAALNAILMEVAATSPPCPMSSPGPNLSDVIATRNIRARSAVARILQDTSIMGVEQAGHTCHDMIRGDDVLRQAAMKHLQRQLECAAPEYYED